MASKSDFRTILLEEIPALRAWAHSLCHNRDLADDLIQETLTKAWANRQAFVLGTSMRAWLYTILRNTYYNLLRQKRREVADAEGRHAESMVAQPAQQAKLELQEVAQALYKLPLKQREVLILIGASGLSYEEAAMICDCSIGTIKSRLSRARQAMAAMLDGGAGGENEGGKSSNVEALLRKVGRTREVEGAGGHKVLRRL
ncbi:MAG TPA: sigma-70 family RNA polymerase sigma factor [Ferrovibrio sp.]|uniref:sigma-70 family RNA polymerase sigma factor n=1 Tax=Ferrovibrio sp. TaxID=1917215 RepID=UPI002ED52ED9